MLSKRQFASAAGATEKWIDNACRLLGRRVDRTEREARWFGLVHAIAVAFDMSLARAANLATRALELDPCSRSATIAAQGDDSMWVVIDLECYHSRFGIALAAALLDQPFHRGPAVRHLTSAARTRPAILCRATALGINTSLLRGLALATPARRLAVLGHDVLTMLQDLSNARIRYILTGDVAAVIRGVPRAKPRLEVLCAPDPIMPTLLAQLLVVFSALALLLSAVGTYGLLASMVAERRREIGIRLALGARPSTVLSGIVKQGLLLTMYGSALGLAGALALNRFVASLLFGVRPTDTTTFVAATATIAAVAAVASWLPAWRASRVDPIVTLRYE